VYQLSEQIKKDVAISRDIDIGDESAPRDENVKLLLMKTASNLDFIANELKESIKEKEEVDAEENEEDVLRKKGIGLYAR
jgi:hypothetical protein